MKCRSCYSTDITPVLDLGEQYLSDFNDGTKPPKFPMKMVKCNECSLVQLEETTPSQELYNDHYGYYSGINKTMRDELAEIVHEAKKRVTLDQDDIVVDIGCNDGTLLSNYDREKVLTVGFEPVRKLSLMAEKHASVILNNFFSGFLYHQAFPDKKAKIITAISMFYDLDDPNSFVEGLAQSLHPEGILVIQQNYLASMLEKNAYDNIVHEHLEYYSLTSLEPLLNRHGLEVVEVEERDLNGGSFRTYIKHMDSVKKMRVKEQLLGLTGEKIYTDFSDRINAEAGKLKAFIQKVVDEGKRVYVYGASTRGNTILQHCGLDNKLITAAVERNPDKWGKYIASVGIPIISEEQARKEMPEYFLVLPWFFADEFIEREKEYLGKGGHLIFPLPEFRVV